MKIRTDNTAPTVELDSVDESTRHSLEFAASSNSYTYVRVERGAFFLKKCCHVIKARKLMIVMIAMRKTMFNASLCLASLLTFRKYDNTAWINWYSFIFSALLYLNSRVKKGFNIQQWKRTFWSGIKTNIRFRYFKILEWKIKLNKQTN